MAEEKEEEIRRLQRELERILRKRKEEESAKATSRPCNHTVKKSVATQTVGDRERQEDSPVEIVSRTAQMKADREFRSAERRTGTSAKQSAILIDERNTPVVLQDMSPVEVTGTERNGPKPSGTVQQSLTSPREGTERERNKRMQSGTVLQEVNPVEVTGTELKESRQRKMVETRGKGLSERMSFDSPSFLDLGRPALDSVRVNLFGPNRHIEDAGSRFRPQAQTERNGLRRNGQLREPRATRPGLGEKRWASLSRRNGESSGDEQGGFTGFEMPQMPAALLARAATLEKAGKAEQSPGGSQEGWTVDCPQKRGRPERPQADGIRPEKGSAQMQKQVWPEHYSTGQVSKEQQSPESDEPPARERRPTERISAEHLSREQQTTECLFAERRLTERRPTDGQSLERWSGTYPHEGEGRQRRPVMLTEQRCRQHSLRLTPVTNGEDSPQSPANRLVAEHRERSQKHFRVDLQQGRCEKVGKRREGSLEEDEDGFFTPGTRAHRVWDPARDPLPSSTEQLMELRDTLQLRVQVRGLIKGYTRVTDRVRGLWRVSNVVHLGEMNDENETLRVI